MSQERMNPGSLWDVELIGTVSANTMEFPETDPPLSINWRSIQTVNPQDSNSSSAS